MDFEQGLAIANQAVLAKTGRRLSATETAILRGAWFKQTYDQISQETNYSAGYLSRVMSPQLWQLLSDALGEPVGKKNVRLCLEKAEPAAGRQTSLSSGLIQRDRPVSSSPNSPPASPPASSPLAESSADTAESPSPLSPLWAEAVGPADWAQLPAVYCDWGEAIDVSKFYGRSQEIADLERWIVNDRCRLVAILGMGGMGKTALSVKLGQQLAASEVLQWGQAAVRATSPVTTSFEFVIWRSLRNAPLLSDLLSDVLQFLTPQESSERSSSLEQQIAVLINVMRRHRCLLILDNVESILQSGGPAGKCRADYEPYDELFRRVGEVFHQSCLVITSREKPETVAMLEGGGLAVRTLNLPGLSPTAAIGILEAKGLVGSEQDEQRLVERYSGNPLALKIVATSIRDLFAGRVSDFLREGGLMFNGIRMLLSQQFERLTDLEQQVMYWLAINREWVSLAELQADLAVPISKLRLFEVLESLGRRSLIEAREGKFTQQPVVMEYITDELIERCCAEITSEVPDLLLSHALIKAQSKDYIRESQVRQILQPLIEQLKGQFPWPSQLEQALQRFLLVLRSPDRRDRRDRHSPPRLSALSDYGPGNLLNLMSYLKLDLTGYDFSRLIVQQAYLHDVSLHQVNFTDATFINSVFAEPLHNNHGLAFSPDGQLLAMTGLDGSLNLFYVATQQRYLTLTAHLGWTLGVAFSPDAATLVTGSFDQTIKLWDLQDGRCLRSWSTDTAVWRVCFSADGRHIISANEDHTIRLWDVQTGQCVRTLTGHIAPVIGLNLSSDGALLLSAGFDQTVRVWDLATGHCRHVLKGHTDSVWGVALNPASTRLASASFDGTIRLWDVHTGDWLQTLHQHTQQVSTVQFSPNGKLLASGGYDWTIRLWDAETGQPLRVLQGHNGAVWSMAFSPDGTLLASGCEDSQVKLWEVSSGRCIRTLRGERMGMLTVQFGVRPDWLFAGGDDARLRVWDTTTGQLKMSLSGHTRQISKIAVHPQGHQVATSSHDGQIKLWNAAGDCLFTFERHPRWASAVDFHPQQPMLASCGAEPAVWLWQTQTGEALGILHQEKNSGYTYALVFHPHQSLLATGCESGEIYLWDTDRRQVVNRLQGHTARTWVLVFQPHTHLLASGSHDNTIRLWDIETGHCQMILGDRSGAVMSLAFSPDGALLADASDRLIRIWAMETQQCVLTLEGHDNAIAAVAFQPQPAGRGPLRLASASYDGTVRIWDIATAKCVSVIRPKRIYEGMNITGAQGITEVQKITLRTLGAVG